MNGFGDGFSGRLDMQTVFTKRRSNSASRTDRRLYSLQRHSSINISHRIRLRLAGLAGWRSGEPWRKTACS